MNTIQWQSPADGKQQPPAPSPAGRTNNIWFAVSLGLIGVIVGYSLRSWSQPVGSAAQNAAPPSVPTAAANPPAPTPPAGPVPPVDLAKDHIRGNKNAAVAVIEYSDFECPFCKSVHPTYQKIMQDYGDKVMWVYRDYPLSFHQNAQKEAEGGECVAELGGNDAFWKYADLIFQKTTSNGTGIALDALPGIAQEAGVDQAAFKTCLDSGKYAAKVQNDETTGAAAGVDGTPGNFVYDMKTKKSTPIIGAVPVEQFKTAIDSYLK
jgi:protein-disulfide isomerase